MLLDFMRNSIDANDFFAIPEKNLENAEKSILIGYLYQLRRRVNKIWKDICTFIIL